MTERNDMKKNEAAASAGYAKEHPVTCRKCGRELKAGSRFCSYCGTPVTEHSDSAPENPAQIPESTSPGRVSTDQSQNSTPSGEASTDQFQNGTPSGEASTDPVRELIRKKKSEEKTMRKYPFFFISTFGEAAEPYIFARLNENGNLIPEPADGGLQSIFVKQITLMEMPKGEQKYRIKYQSHSNEQAELLISNSRLVLINREYNKNEGMHFTGIGGLTAMGIGAALNAANRAVMSSKRKGTALAGQLRYEWIAALYYKRKEKMLEDERIRLIYKDLERTKWNLTISFYGGVNAAALANDILRRACILRSTMLDDRDDETNAFLKKYGSGQAAIPPSGNPDKMSGEAFPVFYFATKGMPFRQEDF